MRARGSRRCTLLVAVNVTPVPYDVAEIDPHPEFDAATGGTSTFRSAISRCTSTAQRTASTTLPNSAGNPSPVVFWDRRARRAALSGVRACPPRPFPSAANPPPHRRRGSRQDGESGSFWQSYATQGVASARLDDDYPLAPAQRQAPRASQEVLPPIRHGQPDWRAWARKLRLLTGQLTIIEVHWLRTDNRPHLDAYERAHPGAGRGGPCRLVCLQQ